MKRSSSRKLGKPSKPTADSVRAWTGDLVFPTYMPALPDKNPMFLEKRVYQGSSGRVYPLPFTDRISQKPIPRKWRAVWIENKFLRVLILPELGGRIHSIQDRISGHDLIYNQPVIKPALVGLAGPWVSGGIEFNWPQHHRPATFLPADVCLEKHADGSTTVWCGEHDPMARMKGMHGVCLHPGKACLELKVRAYNRTPWVQTFLWWANVATRVHEAYQSFFPPDVYYVADHARRSMSEYPQAQGTYYGIDYGERGRKGIPESEIPAQFVPRHCRARAGQLSNAARTPGYAPNDLSFYANIPTPCSYMCMGSQEDFFGGYDHAKRIGIVHVANHHISPGKKQWTWGNHEFGYAWDRNLTDPDAAGRFDPYIEIMAGVYTDNQPDFSFLQPGETKTWSQYWYPIPEIGPAHHANPSAAVSVKFSKQEVRIGVVVTSDFGRGLIRLERTDGSGQIAWRRPLAPGSPLIITERQPPKRFRPGNAVLRIYDEKGSEVLCYRTSPRVQGTVPPPATEPPPPGEFASADELYVTGVHLHQYRHATRCPTLYWKEALRRDPLDSRCNNAMGLWHLQRGEFREAEECFRRAVDRLTRRNGNPREGEAFYNLGFCLRHLGRDVEAYDAFYKATWNQAWAGPGFHALAEVDCVRKNWHEALAHLDRALRLNADNLRAKNLKATVLRKLGQSQEAGRTIRETLRLDPLDYWARHLESGECPRDLQACLDVVHDYASAGFLPEAIRLLKGASARKRDLPDQSWGALPLVAYTLGWLEARRGDAAAARRHFREASAVPSDYCFPARLEEIAVFETAMRSNPVDPKAPYYLGNLLYDRRRHEEAMHLWEVSARLDPGFSIVWRNLGIGYFNLRRDGKKACDAYERALKANPNDARLLYERDQLWKRLGQTAAQRLAELERRLDLVHRRDDLSVELAMLYNQTGQPDKALRLLEARKFQPWEGGEGGPLGQWVRSHLLLGRRELGLSIVSGSRKSHSLDPSAEKQSRRLANAIEHFRLALTAPVNLGEAKHLLANQSDIHFWLGCALAAAGRKAEAAKEWLSAATFRGDFQQMSVRSFSEMTYYSALAWARLGREEKSRKLLKDLLAYSRKLQDSEAKIDYFATSLPTMLLFEDDLQKRQTTTACFLRAQARLGLGDKAQARAGLRDVLRRDPSHALAADLLAEIAS